MSWLAGAIILKADNCSPRQYDRTGCCITVSSANSRTVADDVTRITQTLVYDQMNVKIVEFESCKLWNTLFKAGSKDEI